MSYATVPFTAKDAKATANILAEIYGNAYAVSLAKTYARNKEERRHFKDLEQEISLHQHRLLANLSTISNLPDKLQRGVAQLDNKPTPEALKELSIEWAIWAGSIGAKWV